MTRMEKCFVGLGVCTTTLLAAGFGIVAFQRSDNGKSDKTVAQSAPVLNASQDQSRNSSQGAVVQSIAKAPPVVPALAPLPANATFIPDEYLERLSTMVNLAGARDHAPDKTLWAQALPVAQKLMDGPCDCAQKVWLKHFIEMGDFALSDSATQYHETANLISTLGRNDAQAMALSKKSN